MAEQQSDDEMLDTKDELGIPISNIYKRGEFMVLKITEPFRETKDKAAMESDPSEIVFPTKFHGADIRKLGSFTEMNNFENLFDFAAHITKKPRHIFERMGAGDCMRCLSLVNSLVGKSVAKVVET